MKARSKVSLNALRTFEAVARHKNMVRAADELLVTAGAVSRQISELQSSLSFDLFVGHRTHHILTPAGQQLAASVTKALDDIEATLGAIDTERDKILDVACLSTLAVRWLIPRLHRFRTEHPDIDVRLSTDPRTPHKTGHRMDVSILAHAPDHEIGERDTILFREKLGLVMTPSLAGSQQALQPNDLQDISLLLSKTRPNAWTSWLAIQNVPDRKPPHTSTFEHLSLAIEAAAAGLGICVTPAHLVLDDLSSARLSAPFGFQDSGYVYAAHAHGRPKQKVADFIDWLSRETKSL
ncbi:LysR substrate-binding domain-containing protein [Celeribacter baekdonensis]|uniref:LysR family transcriptional regulator n=1 Tax=Celeribacter baekdonensis TaxID=875171 RepID=A0A2R4M2A0_9RHOB|nr:LysR substrate-binding domain-containing protein [Celeribacter baekdonensis]AVW91237.1 LysR family transcriptional regulator [Celeribacter baekdonensis]|tara:strand:- start:51907 stop:52788 length:882 start_codon:yes stop_codon:yes gene_type:complete